MTKMATVRAQQKWEYMSITRKTEDFLINELNEVGKLGWELVNASHHRDVKSVGGTYCWTAVLKRPLVPQAHAAHANESKEATGSPPGGQYAPQPSDSNTSIFGIREDQPPDEEDIS
jgi:hypothetical protein